MPTTFIKRHVTPLFFNFPMMFNPRIFMGADHDVRVDDCLVIFTCGFLSNNQDMAACYCAARDTVVVTLLLLPFVSLTFLIGELLTICKKLLHTRNANIMCLSNNKFSAIFELLAPVINLRRD
jgi:hypothetical protein